MHWHTVLLGKICYSLVAALLQSLLWMTPGYILNHEFTRQLGANSYFTHPQLFGTLRVCSRWDETLIMIIRAEIHVTWRDWHTQLSCSYVVVYVDADVRCQVECEQQCDTIWLCFGCFPSLFMNKWTLIWIFPYSSLSRWWYKTAWWKNLYWGTSWNLFQQPVGHSL